MAAAIVPNNWLALCCQYVYLANILDNLTAGSYLRYIRKRIISVGPSVEECEMDETEINLMLMGLVLVGTLAFIFPVSIVFELRYRKEETVKYPFIKAVLIGLIFFCASIATMVLLANFGIPGGGCSGLIGLWFLLHAAFGSLIAGCFVGLIYESLGKTLSAWKRQKKNSSNQEIPTGKPVAPKHKHAMRE